MALQIHIEPREKVLYFSLVGDLDISSSPELKAKALEEYEKNPSPMIFDLSALDYLDSTGLGTFISLYNNAKGEGHSISIRNARPNVKKLFTITELDQVFQMDAEEA